jgi:uncharacterized repeat protein (TIGR02543 family)
MILRRWAALCGVLVVVLFASTAVANPHGARDHASDQVLVKLRAGVPTAEAARALAAVGSREVHRFRAVEHLYRVTLAPGVDLHEALRSLRRASGVAYAEPNLVIRTAQAAPNDPYYLSYQWSLQWNAANAEGAWQSTTGSPQVVIAVLDTGVDLQHEDLVPNIFRNEAECNGVPGADDDGNGIVDDCSGLNVLTGGPPIDDSGHGTHVAGIIGAVGNNTIGVAGVNWTVKILPCKFMSWNGDGDVAGAIACLDYVARMKDRGVNIVAANNSWTGSAPGVFSQALHDAIRALRDRGILFVTPAGNAGSNNDTVLPYPCAFELSNVLCVAATDWSNTRAAWSSWGPSTVHLMAPGHDVFSTAPGSSYQFMNGTSMAAAHVSGVVGLLAAQNAARDWRALKNLVLAGTEPHTTPKETITGGRLSAYWSLNCSGRYGYGRLGPRGTDLTVDAGATVSLSFFVANCGDPYPYDLWVQVNPTAETVPLVDTGGGADQVPGDAVFSGTWTVPAGGGVFELSFPDGDVVRVSAMGAGPGLRLKPGFPVQTYGPAGGYTIGQGLHVLVGNIDADPLPEILVSGLGRGELHAFKGDGSPVPGWPVIGPAGAAYPALGELTAGSSGLDVFTGYSPGGLEARAGTGARLPGWPRQASNYVASPATLADIDGDGIDEIFIEEEDWRLHAYRADGSPVPGWPHAGFYGGQERHTSAVADLDGDGRLEIITASGWTSPGVALLAHRSDGTLMPGFPVYFPGHASTYPVVGDVDGDGILEILVAGRVGSGDGVLVYTTTGALKQAMPAVGTVWYGTALALADLDGDGVPEIVMQTNSTVNVWRGDGTAVAGWPVSLPAYAEVGNAAPVVGDVDGDGQPEIVILAPNHANGSGPADLLVFRRDGTLLPSYRTVLQNVGSGMVPAIADVDGDGRNDIIIASEYWSGTPGNVDRVWVFDIADTPSPHGAVLWGQFMGGPKHQGFYGPEPRPTTHALTVAVTGAGSGQVTSSPAGISCGAECVKRFLAGTTVTLTATPNGSSLFTGWTGACAGQGNPCTLTLVADHSVAATFAPRVDLTVQSPGAVGVVTSTPAGIDCGADCVESYPGGTGVTLSFTPAPRYIFAAWSGGCAGQADPCTLTLTGSTTVGVSVTHLWALAVTRAGSGTGNVTSAPAGVTCGSDCSEDYLDGTQVTLTATPATGSVFTGWTGACTGQSATCSVTASADLAVTATFEALHTLTVTRSGTAGSITSAPAGIACGSDCSEVYVHGTSVTLAAAPGSGSAFASWGGACAGQGNPCTVSMTASHSVTATFATARKLTVSITGQGSVATADGSIACPGDCTEFYAHGAVVTLTATPANGRRFDRWSGACSGSSPTCTVTMSANKSVTARFK